MSHLAKSVLAAVGFIVLAFGAALAFGAPGVSVKEEPQSWELRDDQGNPVKDAKGVWIRRATIEEVKTEAVKVFGAAQVAARKFRITTVVGLTVTGVCTGDNPEPPRPVDDDGFTVYPEAPAPEVCPPNMPNPYRLLESRWVVEYPKCGEYRQVEIQACGYVMDEPADGPMPPPTGCVGCDPAAPACGPEGCGEPPPKGTAP